jgi:hypothetical protein
MSLLVIDQRRTQMTLKQSVKVPGVATAFVVIVLAGMFVSSPRVRAQRNNDDHNDGTESKGRIGFQVAPVKLNLAGANCREVGSWRSLYECLIKWSISPLPKKLLG